MSERPVRGERGLLTRIEGRAGEWAVAVGFGAIAFGLIVCAVRGA